MEIFNDEKIIRRISQIDVEQLQRLYRNIFGTDGELEGCELADDSVEFARMLDRVLRVNVEFRSSISIQFQF
jgi:hypothetical protein